MGRRVIQNKPETTRPPKLGTDAHGNTFVAYGQNDPRLSDERPSADQHVLRVTMHSPDRGWGEPVDLGAGNARDIAVRPDGQFVILCSERFDNKLSNLKSRAFSPPQ